MEFMHTCQFLLYWAFLANVSCWCVVTFKSHPTCLSICGKIWRKCDFNEIHRWNLCIPVSSFSIELSWLMSVVDVLSLLKATPLVWLSVAKSEGIVISRWNTYLSNLSFLGSSSCPQVWNLKLSFIASCSDANIGAGVWGEFIDEWLNSRVCFRSGWNGRG